VPLPHNLLTDPEARVVIGHRGAAGEAPENTLVSFALALEQGADALEFDVRTTADGEAVVMHDPAIDRTTDRTGEVSRLTLAELQTADAGARFSTDGDRSWPWRGRGVRIPAVGAVLAAFPTTPMLIEIKLADAAGPLARAILEHDAASRCIVAGEDDDAVAPFRHEPFLAGASRRDIIRLVTGALIGRTPQPGGPRLYAVPLRFRGLRVASPRVIRAARKAGAPVHVWTVDDAAIAQGLWRDGAAGIVTNYPSAIRLARESAGPKAG
jgi:glycerophosphoryl diester phosphodiesterase